MYVLHHLLIDVHKLFSCKTQNLKYTRVCICNIFNNVCVERGVKVTISGTLDWFSAQIQFELLHMWPGCGRFTRAGRTLSSDTFAERVKVQRLHKFKSNNFYFYVYICAVLCWQCTDCTSHLLLYVLNVQQKQIVLPAGAIKLLFVWLPYKWAKVSFKWICKCLISMYISILFLCVSPQRPSEKCRYVVGSVLCEGEEKPDEELQKLYEKFGFKVFSLPEVSHAVTTTFPCTTPLSHVLGPYRVYPRLVSYIEVQCENMLAQCG